MEDTPKGVNFNKLLLNLKNRQTKKFISEKEKRTSERVDKLLNLRNVWVDDIDFTSFSLQELDEVLCEIRSYVPSGQFSTTDIMANNRFNPIYRNERISYAIERLCNNKKKNYQEEEENEFLFI